MNFLHRIGLKKVDLSAEPWAILMAGLSVVLLLFVLFMPQDHRSRLNIDSPGQAQAALMQTVHTVPDAHDVHATTHGTGHYACPMMCVPPSDHPGTCPVCGMALTPVRTHETASPTAAPRLQLSPEAIHLADIRTAAVQRMPVATEVRLFGRIDFDSAHITKITAFMPGVIDRVYIKRAGQFVRWGDPLFDIYSSDLLETQRQLVAAMQYVPSFLAFQANTPHVAQDAPVQVRKRGRDDGQRTPEQEEALQKIAALRHKLSILGLPKRDIDQFMRKGEATGIATVYAPMYGQIIRQDATEGTFVNTGTSLFTIADPQYVWARLDAYESDYPWIRIGQRVTFTCEAYPGEVFEAKVAYIDPVFDPKTRTFSIGAITTEDQGGRLKAGMLVRAAAHARLNAKGSVHADGPGTSGTPLVIPVTAPLITGKRAVVYVADDTRQGSFEGREVMLGPRTRTHYVVRGGLTEGERVVVNGNFKIDSAMQISARPSLMYPSGGVPMAGHDHHGESARPGMAGHSGGAARVQPSVVQESLADGHQHVDLADRMNDDYMGQRHRSRTVPAGDHAVVDGHVEHEHLIQEKPEHVRRRRPGQYGDTTRQGQSLLEAHRSKYRRP